MKSDIRLEEQRIVLAGDMKLDNVSLMIDTPSLNILPQMLDSWLGQRAFVETRIFQLAGEAGWQYSHPEDSLQPSTSYQARFMLTNAGAVSLADVLLLVSTNSVAPVAPTPATPEPIKLGAIDILDAGQSSPIWTLNFQPLRGISPNERQLIFQIDLRATIVPRAHSRLAASEAPPRLRVAVPLFGWVSLSQNDWRGVQLCNVSPLPLIINTITLLEACDFGVGIPVMPVTIPPFDQVGFVLTFTPTQAGERTGTLVVKSNDPFFPSTMVGLSGGIGGKLSAQGGKITFAARAPAHQGTLHVTLVNESQRPLTITKILLGNVEEFVLKPEIDLSRSQKLEPGGIFSFKVDVGWNSNSTEDFQGSGSITAFYDKDNELVVPMIFKYFSRRPSGGPSGPGTPQVP